MRADPEHRRPAPPRRRADFLPTAARAWGLVVVFARRAPALVAGGAVAFAAGDLVPAALLERAHIGLGGSGDLVADFGRWGAAWLYGLMVARYVLPPVVAAGLFLAMQRVFMAGGGKGLGALRDVASWARVSAALLAAKLAGTAALWTAANVPALLVLMLGQISALLTLVLFAPLFIMAVVSAVRLSLAPPALALGLAKAAAESWEITRGRVRHIVGVWLVTSAPVAAAATALAWWGVNSYLLAVLPLGLLALLLAGAVSSLLYKSYRLPAHMRPDRRPSRNRSRRAEPALAK
jgi:hypothetical protein